MQIAMMHELICMICKLGVSSSKCDFLILFQKHSLAVTEDILVTEHARKLGFAAIYQKTFLKVVRESPFYYFNLSYLF